MNNGNVTRAAVGIAKRLWGRLESILKRFVLWVKHGPFWLTWGQESFTGKTWARTGEAGRQAGGRQAGQAGRQAGGAGRQGAGRGQTKSPRREAGGRDRGGDLGRDQLGHLEAVEGIHSRRYSCNGAFSEQGRDLSRLVVSLKQHAFGREAQRLRRDFRRFRSGSSSGSGDALGL